MNSALTVLAGLGLTAATLGFIGSGSPAQGLADWAYPPSPPHFLDNFNLQDTCRPPVHYTDFLVTHRQEQGWLISVICYIYGACAGETSGRKPSFDFPTLDFPALPEGSRTVAEAVRHGVMEIGHTLAPLAAEIHARWTAVSDLVWEIGVHLLLSVHYMDIVKVVGLGSCALLASKFIRDVFSVTVFGARLVLTRLGVRHQSLLSAITAQYVVVKLIHTNTSCHKFRMTSKLSGRDVFMKCLRKGSGEAARRRLASEHQRSKALRHPNIVQFVDWIQVGNLGGLGLEFAPFGNLKDAMAGTVSSMTSFDKFVVFRQAVSAVEFLHSSGLAHLDIRPGSLLVFDQWALVKLSGFTQMVKIHKDGDCSHFDLHPIAKPPEVSAQKPYDPAKADVWALGSLFFYILTGDYCQKDEVTPLQRLVLPNLEGCDVAQRRGVLHILASVLTRDPAKRQSLAQIIDKFKYLGH